MYNCVEKLPFNVPGLAHIREQSTSFTQVVVTNGIEVRLEGWSNVYIFPSPKLAGRAKEKFKKWMMNYYVVILDETIITLFAFIDHLVSFNERIFSLNRRDCAERTRTTRPTT